MIGISSRPTTDGSDTNYTTAVVQQVIDYMNAKGLDTYRMCFHLSVNKTLRDSLIQYYLDHYSYDLILNYYHDAFGTAISSAQWTATINAGLALMSKFKAYESRITYEIINERTNTESAFYSNIQNALNSFKNAGYNPRVNINRWYTQSWSEYAKLVNANSNFETGTHCYFNTNNLSGFQSSMNAALAAGIPASKLVNTEIGADTLEYPQFQKTEVDGVNAFLSWCKDRGIGNCVWMLHGIRNWTANSQTNYQVLGLTFPTIQLPPTATTKPKFHIQVNIQCLTDDFIRKLATTNVDYLLFDYFRVGLGADGKNYIRTSLGYTKDQCVALMQKVNTLFPGVRWAVVVGSEDSPPSIFPDMRTQAARDSISSLMIEKLNGEYKGLFEWVFDDVEKSIDDADPTNTTPWTNRYIYNTENPPKVEAATGLKVYLWVGMNYLKYRQPPPHIMKSFYHAAEEFPLNWNLLWSYVSTKNVDGLGIKLITYGNTPRDIPIFKQYYGDGSQYGKLDYVGFWPGWNLYDSDFPAIAALVAEFKGELPPPPPPPPTFPCPYGDGFSSTTQAGLDAHILEVHTAPPPPEQQKWTFIIQTPQGSWTFPGSSGTWTFP